MTIAHPDAKSRFHRYNQSDHCPVCLTGSKNCSRTHDGLQWCRGTPADPNEWVCVKSGPVWGSYRRVGDRYSLRSGRVHHHRPQQTQTAPVAWRVVDWGRCAQQFANGMTPARRRILAAMLRVSVASLAAMPLIGVNGGTSDGGLTFTFPEFGGDGRTAVGISTRTERPRRYHDDEEPRSKSFIHGGNRGLTIPGGWRDRPGPLFVVEGASDVLALTAAGCAAIGRANNTHGVKELTELLHDLDPNRPIVFVGENDRKPNGDWPGRTGPCESARQLSTALRRPVVLAMTPDGRKDARAYLTAPNVAGTPWADRGTEFTAAILSDVDHEFDPPSRTLSNASPIPSVRTGPLTPLMQGFDANGVLIPNTDSTSCCVCEEVDEATRGIAKFTGPKPSFECERPRAKWQCGCHERTEGKDSILKVGCRGCGPCLTYKRWLDKSRYVPHALAAGTHYHIGTDEDREKLRLKLFDIRKRLKLKDPINYATCGEFTVYALGHIKPNELPTDCGLEPATGEQCAQLLADRIEYANPLERMKGERSVHASQKWPNALKLQEEQKEKFWKTDNKVRVVITDFDLIEQHLRDVAGDEPIDIQRGTSSLNGESKLSGWTQDRIVFELPIGKRGEIIDRITCRAEPSTRRRDHTSNEYRPDPSPIPW